LLPLELLDNGRSEGAGKQTLNDRVHATRASLANAPTMCHDTFVTYVPGCANHAC
jgi:hypothetical protein